MFYRARIAISASPWQRLRSFGTGTTKYPSSRSKSISGVGENNQWTGAAASTTEEEPPSSSSSSCSRPKQNSANVRRVVRNKNKEVSYADTNKRRFKQPQRKDHRAQHQPLEPKALPVIQPSMYYYCTPVTRPSGTGGSGSSSGGDKPPSRLVLPAMNASAFLDPLKYCKTTSRLSQNRAGVSRSISGTDAARRLLRGKKDFIVAARSLKNQPALLEGHGVPQQLFQHCIDMADALLLQYSPDVVECTFHNYNYITGESKLPNILRVRSRDATNRCSPWPPENTNVQDWDYHLQLYLTVMERIACNLGMVLQKKQTQTTATGADEKVRPSIFFEDDQGGDGDELTSSPFLFPNFNIPQWNVDILRGSYFDVHLDGPDGRPSKAMSPMPIVEFTKESETTAHVLIRIQGESMENMEFGSQRSSQPVTLVFDACFRSDRS